MTGQAEWDKFFLGMAKYVSTASKDPSTKTGAVIVDWNRRVVSVGYNGFAKGVEDYSERYENRTIKYSLICHCEVNAVIFAHRDLSSCQLYTYPFCSCSRCAGVVIQSGITRCIAPPLPESLKQRWEEDVKLTELQFREAGVQLDYVDF